MKVSEFVDKYQLWVDPIELESDLDEVIKDENRKFIAWDTENGFNSSQRDILNWFKQHIK